MGRQNPTSQLFCRLDCAIESPEKTIAPDEDDTRLDVFQSWRNHYISQAVEDIPLSDSLLRLSDEEIALQSRARACAEKIIEGECAMFLLNSGQYPRYERGLIRYDVLLDVLDENH